jgi:pyochelin synthetase
VLAYEDAPLDRRLAAFVELARRQGLTEEPQALAARVAARMEADGTELKAGVDCEEIVRFAQQLDVTALIAMVRALRQHGLFAGAEDLHSTDDILRQARVAPEHHRLIRRWLNALEANHLLERDPASSKYCHLASLAPAALTEAWESVATLQPKIDRRTELLEYFRTAEQHLPELMHGELDPVALLFPEGRVEIHEVAYNDSFLGRYLNSLVTAAVCEIARHHPATTPLRVLEIGAGVGGTSIELIPALAQSNVEYLFTDVSQFFLNNASERFRDYPWVKYALFDMNQDYRAQDLAPNSFDVIVCANVLHYAVNANIVLARIRELLQPGGWLVLIDMVRDNYQVLTSMEFLFDANLKDFEDVRQGHDATFINLAQWHSLLATPGAQTAQCLPRADDVLSKIGFHVFAVQFKTDREPVTTRELLAHLADRIPHYMLPPHLEILDALPLTANGKIDRKTFLSWLSLKKKEHTITAQNEPENDLERRLAAIWAAVIGVKSVGRNQDFFEIGGDSLLAAQLVGRIREEIPEARPIFFDSLLRSVLEQPTVAQLAAHLERPQTSDASLQPQSSPLIHLAKTADGPLRVLVHDASGTLASYNHLFSALSAAGSLAGLVVNDTEAYLQIQSRMLVESRATKYAQLLRSENRNLELIGYQFGGIVAAELASRLVEVGFPVKSLTVIGGSPVPCQVEDELLTEYLFINGSGIDPVQLGFPPEAGLGRALALIRSRTPGIVAEGELAKLSGDPELAGVAWCFRRLAALPQADRLTSFSRTLASPGSEPAPLSQVTLLYSIFRHSIRAGAESKMSPYAGDITVLQPTEQIPVWPSLLDDTICFWKERCLGKLRIIDVPGNAYACLRAEHAPHLAQMISECLG